MPHIVNGSVITRIYVVTLLHASRTIRHERCCVAERRVAAGNDDKQGHGFKQNKKRLSKSSIFLLTILIGIVGPSLVILHCFLVARRAVLPDPKLGYPKFNPFFRK